jgi:hypothetical protein
MITSTLEEFKIKGYDELYQLYMDGELGVLEQRMPVVPKWEVGKDGTELQLIRKLLDRDPDNLWHVTFLDYGVDSYFKIAIVGLQIAKKFNEPVLEWVLTFGEDGIWQDAYQIDNPTHAKDGTMFGDLNVSDMED